jgi:hypothetical protein
MQIALVAVVLLAGMWFTVLRPKPATEAAAPAPAAASAPSQPVAPGVKGLTNAVDKAKGAAATSDAANAAVQQATGSAAATAAPSATAAAPAKSTSANPLVRKLHASPVKTPAKAHAVATPAVKHAAAPSSLVRKVHGKPGTVVAGPATAPSTSAAAKTAPASTVATTSTDPSETILNVLSTGKVVVLLFHGDGADDQAARKAVHTVAADDTKHVVSAYADIAKVGAYEAITSGIQVTTAPTILVIGPDKKAQVLTGYVDAGVIKQAVGDALRADKK